LACASFLCSRAGFDAPTSWFIDHGSVLRYYILFVGVMSILYAIWDGECAFWRLSIAQVLAAMDDFV
jgi:hypothetical protein